MSGASTSVRRWISSSRKTASTAAASATRSYGPRSTIGSSDATAFPTGALVPTREDALRLLGKQRQAERFARLAALTLGSCPELRAWIEKKPKTLLDHADDWERVLAVLAWFRAHPRPGVYLRQLDVAGVDTKFIEARKGLLMELLDIMLPQESIDASAKRDFEGRYGLLSKPPRVRFRILDREHYIGGLSDITVPASQFAELEPSVRRVFITENEINGLAFPHLPDAAVIFGLGYALDRLADVRWLRNRTIYYWGDIDTHGFAILDRLRAAFPEATSLLMDRETLMQHQSLWVGLATPGPPPPLDRRRAGPVRGARRQSLGSARAAGARARRIWLGDASSRDARRLIVAQSAATIAPRVRRRAGGFGSLDTNTRIHPTLLVDVEVTSKSTEKKNRGLKLEDDLQVNSLDEYLIVSHQRSELELWTRRPDGWTRRLVTEGALRAEGRSRIDVNRLYAELPP